MPTSSSNLEQSATLLMFVSGYTYRLLRHEARSMKIRWTALMVLKDLELLGPSNQRSLAEIEQVRPPTMTVLIRQMEKRGWIVRNPDPADARASLVSITAAGRKELGQAGQTLRIRLEAEIAGLKPTELKALSASLDALSKTLMSRIGKQ